ncbi:MAG: hypothetical protein ACHQ1H_02975 [Nitrososphaerales archaeon]
MLVHVFARKTIELSIVPLSEIKPHEDTIPDLLDSLTRDMARTKLQRDPLLVDRKTHMALDGMHRRAALQKLGAKFAVCAEYNYLDEEIKLERWLRYFIAPDSNLLSKLSLVFKMKSCPGYRPAAKIVDEDRGSVALLSAAESLVSRQKGNPSKVYEKIKKAAALCKAAKIQVEFAPESSRFELFTSESVYVLYPKILRKQDVLYMAEKNRVFPCKTTRHVVPVRPMGIYFPLNDLTNSSYERCTEKLETIVKGSKITREDREVWYEGRRYSEPLAIFRREK